MTVLAEFFCACNVTFQNTAPSPLPGEEKKQAVALVLAGEKSMLYHCRVLGFQDTLYDKAGKHFVFQSYVRGTVDFVFGSGQTIYKECVLESVAVSSGAFTASGRSGPDETGFLFDDCQLTGSGQVYLGRAWGLYARTVFNKCKFGNVVHPVGWATMIASEPDTSNVFFGEFQCTGPGSNLSQRVPWRRTLTEDDMKQFVGYQFIHGDDWLKLDS